jgi:hypothetical protein
VSAPAPSASAVRAIRLLEIDRVTAEVVDTFRAAGVRSILLKGPALARWLYDGAERGYVDCDLLVANHQIDTASELLAQLGFRRSPLDLRDDWPRHARVFLRSGVAVDLHRTFVGADVAPAVVWREVSARTATMHVGGTDVEVPVPSARALVVVLHAAKDGERVEKVDRDLQRALDRVPGDIWTDAMALAHRLGAIEAFAAGLRRIEDGAALARRLGLPTSLTPELAMRTRPVPPLATGLNWLVTSRGVRGKVSLVVRKLFPPPDFLRAWKPLARRGRLGLAIAYVWRPLWVLWYSVPAAFAVARAHLLTRGRAS